ncbi:AraC family transcriptional regulator [Burkholderia sp. Bp9126]|nr:AraC family transcriptional regulator [Burkholderia sp. Bp9126]
MFGRLSGQIRTCGAIYPVPADCIVITREAWELCDAGADTDIHGVDFYTADFRNLYTEINTLIEPRQPKPFWSEPIRVIETAPEVIDMLELLAPVSRSALLNFLYVYCLTTDRLYFSNLLHTVMSGGCQFIEFVDEHALNRWSVTRFANECGLPLRKFNLLFTEKYGISAKRWLLERRLMHAQHLLASTSMRILDIAYECGFANHAHFTDTFRRRFSCSPKEFRTRMLPSHSVI